MRGEQPKNDREIRERSRDSPAQAYWETNQVRLGEQGTQQRQLKIDRGSRERERIDTRRYGSAGRQTKSGWDTREHSRNSCA